MIRECSHRYYNMITESAMGYGIIVNESILCSVSVFLFAAMTKAMPTYIIVGHHQQTVPMENIQ